MSRTTDARAVAPPKRAARRTVKRPAPEPRVSLADQAIQLQQWIETGVAERLRKRAGLSLAAAGQDIEVDAAAVLKWERGEHRPRGRNIRAYHQFLRQLMASLGEECAAS